MQNNTLLFIFELAKANAVLARRLSGHGLDLTDYIILFHLHAAPEGKLRRVDLADKLGLTPSGITRMLVPLEKLHIIERDQDEADARARYARLTAAGQELLRDATATICNRLEDLIPADAEKDLAKMTALLASLCRPS